MVETMMKMRWILEDLKEWIDEKYEVITPIVMVAIAALFTAGMLIMSHV